MRGTLCVCVCVCVCVCACVCVNNRKEFLVKQLSSSEALLWLQDKYIGTLRESVFLEWVNE